MISNLQKTEKKIIIPFFVVSTITDKSTNKMMVLKMPNRLIYFNKLLKYRNFHSRWG